MSGLDYLAGIVPRTGMEEVDKTRVTSGRGAAAHQQLTRQHLDTLPLDARVQVRSQPRGCRVRGEA